MANTTTTSKENDYLLNRMSNNDFTNLDFVNVGLNGDNTSLESKETYEKLAYVQNNEMFQTDGKFDQQKFDDFYKETLAGYNQLTNLDTAKVVASQLSYFKGDIFAPLEQRDFSPQFVIEKTYRNPDRQKISNWGFNSKSDPTKSAREIGQTQLTYDYVTGEWVDSPNDDGFFGNFFDTKVLATYDSDGTHIDPVTGEEVKHKKGQKKLNENGTYYYETLGDRDIYGKDVLSKFDVLTTDGSAWNQYDFFDSDDIEKSIGGTLVRNIVKVAPAFIPYVAPWYIGARVGLETVNLFSKVGKMIAGSDSPSLSAIEGFVKSTNFSTSDYGAQHMWSAENIINMGADVFTQLAEQRWLFEYAPSLMKGSKIGFSKEAQKKFTTDFQASKIKQLKETKNKLSELARKSGGQLDEILWSDGAMKASALAEANLALENALKSNYKIGEYLSKAYMTGVTVADSYGEAKLSGASDLEAALFTLGYAAGEMAILNTQLGEWILPELRVEKQKMRQIIKQLSGNQPPVTATTKEKVGWMKGIIRAGKEWFNGEMADTGTSKILATHMISNALGEGIEETAEEALADISKVLANGVYWATGSKTHLRPTWEDEEGNINIMHTLSDYALNFVGGVIGGGLGNLLPAYREASRIKNLHDKNSAYQELLYYLREGKGDEIKQIASKMQLGNKDLSIFRNEDGYLPAQKGDNQDLSAKVQFNAYIDKLQEILDLEKDVVKSDSEIRMDLILKDLRFQHLLDSKVASSYLQDYHTTVAQLTKVDEEIESLRPSTSVTGDSKEKDAQKENEKKIEEKNKEREELREKLTKFIDGTEGKNYIKDALFEMEHGLSKGYKSSNILEYIQAREIYDGHSRQIKDIPKEVLDQYKSEWEAKSFDHRDEVRFKRIIFDVYNDKLSKKLQGHLNEYMDDFNDKFFVKTFENAVTDIKTVINDQSMDLTLSSQILNNFLAVNQSSDSSNIITEHVDNISAQNVLTDVLVRELVKQNPDNQELVDTFEAIRHLERPELLYDGESDSLRITQEQYTNLYNLDPTVFHETGIPQIIPADQTALMQIAQTLSLYHKELFDKFASNLFTQKSNEITNLISNTKYIKASTRQYLKDFIKDHTDENTYNFYEQTIDKVKYTPINELLDAEQLVLEDSSIKLTDLVTALQAETYKAASSGTLAEFGYDDVTWEEAINHAEQLINILASHLAAGRTDDINPTLPFGYNYTINKLIPESELVTYDVNTYNVLAQDLNKLQTELQFYKRIIQINENNLFALQPKVAVERLFRITEGLKLMFRPDVDVQDWEGYQEFINAISAAHTSLSELFRTQGVLSDQKQVEYRKVRLALNEAIYKFFDLNSSKTQEQFTALFTSNPAVEREFLRSLQNDAGDNYESVTDGDIINVKSVFSYLAANASLQYGSFLKKYKEVIKEEKDFVHTEGAENLLFHEVSFATSKKYWELFTETYNTIQENILKSGSIPNYPYYLNSKDSGKSNHSTLLYKSTFLAEGIAGVGKSSANLTLFLKLTSGIGKLQEKIFLVSKTLEDAQNLRDFLIKTTGLTADNFVCFSHESYINHINPNRAQSTLSRDLITYSDEEVTTKLVKKDDQTWHYNNEDELNLDKITPTFVIVDEATNMSTLDSAQHEAYINAVGTKALFIGDFNQTTIHGQFNTDEGTEQLFNHRHNFFETFGLVFSFRADNKYNIDSQKSIIYANESIKKELQRGDIFEQIDNLRDHAYKLQYNESDNGLFGIKTDSYDDTQEFDPNGDVAKSINIMLNSLSNENGKQEHITYIYNSEDSGLYKYLKSLNVGDKVKFVQGSAQGREGQYYIIEEPILDIQDDPDNFNAQSQSDNLKRMSKHLKDMYTNLSRAKQGSLLITNPRGLNQFDDWTPISSTPMNTVGKFRLSQQFKESQNIKISEQISTALGEESYPDLSLQYKIGGSKKSSKSPEALTDEELIKHAEELLKSDSDEVSFGDTDDTLSELKKRKNLKKTPDKKLDDLIHQLEELREKLPEKQDESYIGSDGSFSDEEKAKYKQPDDGSYCIGQMYSFNAYDPGIDEKGNLLLDYSKVNKQKDDPNGVINILERARQNKLTIEDLKTLASYNISITSLQGLVLLGAVKYTIKKDTNGNIEAIKISDEALKDARYTLHRLMLYFKYGELSGFNINQFLASISKKFSDDFSFTSRIAVKINQHEIEKGRFANGRLENVRGIQKDKESKITPRNKKICAVIGLEGDGNEYTPVLEIPLFTYPNPLSLLESFGLKDEFNKFRPSSPNKKLTEFIASLSDPKYNYLKKLHRIFTSDANSIYYIPNEDNQFVKNIQEIQDKSNSNKPLINTSIDIVSQSKGEDYEFTTEFEYLKSTQKLSELLGNPESNIYVHRQAFVLKDKEDIVINGQVVVASGKPYIIISEDPNIQNQRVTTSSLLGDYIREMNLYGTSKYKLISINSPVLNVDKYIDMLTDVGKSQNYKDVRSQIAQLGNKTTILKILSIILQDNSKLNELLNDSKFFKVYKGRLDALKNLVTTINEIINTDVKDKKITITKLLCTSLPDLESEYPAIAKKINACNYTVTHEGGKSAPPKQLVHKQHGSTTVSSALLTEFVNLIYYGYQFETGLNKHNRTELKKGNFLSDEQIGRVLNAVKEDITNAPDLQLLYNIPISEKEQNHGDFRYNNNSYSYLGLDVTIDVAQGIFKVNSVKDGGELEVSGKLDTCSLFGDISKFINAGVEATDIRVNNLQDDEKEKQQQKKDWRDSYQGRKSSGASNQNTEDPIITQYKTEFDEVKQLRQGVLLKTKKGNYRGLFKTVSGKLTAYAMHYDSNTDTYCILFDLNFNDVIDEESAKKLFDKKDQLDTINAANVLSYKKITDVELLKKLSTYINMNKTPNWSNSFKTYLQTLDFGIQVEFLIGLSQEGKLADSDIYNLFENLNEYIKIDRQVSGSTTTVSIISVDPNDDSKVRIGDIVYTKISAIPQEYQNYFNVSSKTISLNNKTIPLNENFFSNSSSINIVEFNKEHKNAVEAIESLQKNRAKLLVEKYDNQSQLQNVIKGLEDLQKRLFNDPNYTSNNRVFKGMMGISRIKDLITEDVIREIIQYYKDMDTQYDNFC